MRLFLLLTMVALLAACGGAPAPGPATHRPPSPENDLLVEIDRGDGTPPETYRLTCGDTAEGTHPAARAACDHLRAMENPFAPIPGDIACTEQFGGPQTAQVSGVWRGDVVDMQFSRVDGCRIAQWDGRAPRSKPRR